MGALCLCAVKLFWTARLRKTDAKRKHEVSSESLEKIMVRAGGSNSRLAKPRNSKR